MNGRSTLSTGTMQRTVNKSCGFGRYVCLSLVANVVWPPTLLHHSVIRLCERWIMKKEFAFFNLSLELVVYQLVVLENSWVSYYFQGVIHAHIWHCVDPSIFGIVLNLFFLFREQWSTEVLHRQSGEGDTLATDTHMVC